MMALRPGFHSRLVSIGYLISYVSAVLSAIPPASTPDSEIHSDHDTRGAPLLKEFEERRTWVPLPVDNPTKSFWLDTPSANPLAEVGSTGRLTGDADVCIIGSGITGVSAAWHLSNLLGDQYGQEDKTSVVILEARQFCSGATGRNGGHLLPNLFSSFLSRQASYNTSEALKTYLIENYTTKTILRFIDEKNLGDTVDLVDGKHISLFKMEDEELDARKDYEAAKAASLESDLEADLGVRWLGNEELIKEYGLSSELNYTGVYFGGYNLWPCKVVTELFQDVQSYSKNVKVALHTKTPVTRILPIQSSENSREQVPLSSTNAPGNTRQWRLDTPRGDIQCSYVIHATNAYAAHLLPFMTATSPLHVCIKPGNGCLSQASHSRTHALQAHHSPDFTELSRPPVHIPRPHPLPPNPHTIVPTRGQVGAVRASVNASTLGWLNSWDRGGWYYWFPRYQETSSSKNPLIILGGARHHAKRLEEGVADDSEINLDVSTALRGLLPQIFPSQFEAVVGGDGAAEDLWEMEWTGVMGFTKSGDPFVGPIGPLVDGATYSRVGHLEGQYIAAGYSGHGMTRAFACAEAVAGMISAKIRGEEWIAPKWLPESYLTWAKKTS